MKPIVVFVCGDRSSGKSSFINSIAGKLVVDMTPNVDDKILVVGTSVPELLAKRDDINHISMDVVSDDPTPLILVEVPHNVEVSFECADLVICLINSETSTICINRVNIIDSKLNHLESRGIHVKFRCIMSKFPAKTSREVLSESDNEDDLELACPTSPRTTAEKRFEIIKSKIDFNLEKFNSFGRILHGKTSSSKLKSFVESLGSGPSCHHEFKVGTATEITAERESKLVSHILSSIGEITDEETIELINSVTMPESVEKLFKGLADRQFFCMTYFTKSKKNIFTEMKHYEITTIAQAFLIGLGKINAFRYLVINRAEITIENESFLDFTQKIAADASHKSGTNFIDQFIAIETNDDKTKLYEKNFIERVETFRGYIYGNNDPIDVRMLIVAKLAGLEVNLLH